jgi:hypothetical protein
MMMKITSLYFSFCFFLTVYFSGCQPYSRVEVQVPSPQDERAYPIKTKMIDDRIRNLEQALRSNDQTPDDRQVTMEFIGAYSNLKKLISLMDKDPNNELIINNIFQRICFIEERYFKAMDIYGQLADDLEGKESLVAKSGNQLDKSQEQRSEEEKDLRDSDIQTDDMLSGLIQEANQLAQKHAFTEAKLLLIKARIKTANDSEIQIIDQALKDIESIQNRIEQGEDPVNVFSEKEVQLQAATLIEEERYEDAIHIIEKLEEQQDLDDETKRFKDLAVEKIINRDRNRAAQLFLQAKNTQDYPRKKELLKSSLEILKNLVEKYPSSYLIQRINDHILIVEKSLNEW